MSFLAKKLSVTVNGSPMELVEGTTVSELLTLLEINSVLVAVEQNLEIVSKSEFAQRRVFEGDKIEIVHFVGGG